MGRKQKPKLSRAKRQALAAYATEATKYAREVVAGRILACKWVRLACKRHLDDLVKARGKEFPYKFDPVRAGKVCAFIERLPHVKGRWARDNTLIHLEPWQLFIVCSIFGWVSKETGFRRFIEAIVLVPRKNGKTLLVAGIGLYMFVGDGEPGSEVYCGASNKKQAMEVFAPAAKMARRADGFREWFQIEIGKETMYVPDEGSKFEPVIGNPGDGPSPHCFIHDEFHEQPTPEQYDTAKTGTMAREGSLQVTISTAGTDIESPCHQLQRELERILDGVVENDRIFGINYTVDDPEQWDTLEAARMANPNYGISVLADKIEAALKTASQQPGKQNSYKTKNLNIWVNARTVWIPIEKWRKCGDESLSIEEFLKHVCCEGLDLAAKVDLASRVKVFVEMRGEDRHYFVFGRHYVPKDRAFDGKHQHYEAWVKTEKLIAHDGPEIRLAVIQNEIEEDIGRLPNLKHLCFDPWSALQMQQELETHTDKDTVLTIPQQVQHLSPAMKEVEAAVLGGRLHHDGDPVLAWAISNVMVKPDANENIFPRKEDNGIAKIDPATALFNAISRSMVVPVCSAATIEVW